MNRIYILICLVAALVLSSCSGVNKLSHVRTTSFNPELVLLELDLDDMQFLGDDEISYTSHSYFGMIAKLDSINNQVAVPRYKEYVSLSGFSDIRLNRYMQQAAIQTIEKYPDADYFVPMHTTKRIQKMFMGRRTKEVMKIGAYKIKK